VQQEANKSKGKTRRRRRRRGGGGEKTATTKKKKRRTRVARVTVERATHDR
jgi:hypothetical protein